MSCASPHVQMMLPMSPDRFLDINFNYILYEVPNLGFYFHQHPSKNLRSGFVQLYGEDIPRDASVVFGSRGLTCSSPDPFVCTAETADTLPAAYNSTVLFSYEAAKHRRRLDPCNTTATTSNLAKTLTASFQIPVRSPFIVISRSYTSNDLCI